MFLPLLSGVAGPATALGSCGPMDEPSAPSAALDAAQMAPHVVSAILADPMLRQALAEGLRGDDPWLDVHGAAKYLGITPKALRKIAGERREIVYEQDGPGCKMWFRRSALDSYRAGHRRRP